MCQFLLTSIAFNKKTTCKINSCFFFLPVDVFFSFLSLLSRFSFLKMLNTMHLSVGFFGITLFGEIQLFKKKSLDLLLLPNLEIFLPYFFEYFFSPFLFILFLGLWWHKCKIFCYSCTGPCTSVPSILLVYFLSIVQKLFLSTFKLTDSFIFLLYFYAEPIIELFLF